MGGSVGGSRWAPEPLSIPTYHLRSPRIQQGPVLILALGIIEVSYLPHREGKKAQEGRENQVKCV